MQANAEILYIAALSRSCKYLHSETKSSQPTAISWLINSKESNSMLAKMLLLTAILPWPGYFVGLSALTVPDLGRQHLKGGARAERAKDRKALQGLTA